jgi:hypothetical protein
MAVCSEWGNAEEPDQLDAALTRLAGGRPNLAQPFRILEMRGLARDTRGVSAVIALRYKRGRLFAAGDLVREFCWQSCVHDTTTRDTTTRCPTENEITKFRQYYDFSGW